MRFLLDADVVGPSENARDKVLSQFLPPQNWITA